jgi:phage head maturation protease
VKHTLREAATDRSAGVRARADRPSQRRSTERAGSPAVVAAPMSRCEIRGADGDGPLVFDGMATVYERGYEMWDMFGPYTEYVHMGAGAVSMARADLDVPLVLGHNPMQRLARTGNPVSPLILTEVNDGDRPGLHVLAPSLQRDNPWVSQIVPLLRTGLIDEMSFRFMITAGRWNEDWDEYHIHAYEIHRGDTAIVGYGANPHTAGSGLRSQPQPEGLSSSARMLLELSRADDVRPTISR